MEKWAESDLVPGAFLEFRKGINKGTWKIIGVRKLSDGENEFYRITIDKDTTVAGDEKVIEWSASEPFDAYILDIFDQFTEEESDGWPPPNEIEIGEDEDLIEFKTVSEPGFVAHDINNSDEIRYFEYEDSSGKHVLQIYNEDGIITMYLGYFTHTDFINLI